MLISTCDFIKNKNNKNPLQSSEPVLALGAIYNPAPNDVYCCQRTKKEARTAGKEEQTPVTALRPDCQSVSERSANWFKSAESLSANTVYGNPMRTTLRDPSH